MFEDCGRRGKDGTKRRMARVKKTRQRGKGKNGEGFLKMKRSEMMKKERKREKERKSVRDSGKKDQDLSWDLLAILQKRIPILTTAAQQDVEMADPALYLNLC